MKQTIIRLSILHVELGLDDFQQTKSLRQLDILAKSKRQMLSEEEMQELQELHQLHAKADALKKNMEKSKQQLSELKKTLMKRQRKKKIQKKKVGQFGQQSKMCMQRMV